jgi:hypothetical protein
MILRKGILEKDHENNLMVICAGGYYKLAAKGDFKEEMKLQGVVKNNFYFPLFEVKLKSKKSVILSTK